MNLATCRSDTQLKGTIMRLLFIGLLILGPANAAHAIDLGGLLDTIEKGASSIQGDQDAQSGKKKQTTFGPGMPSWPMKLPNRLA